MAWIESHQSLSTHPKVLDLSARMNWTIDETLGKLHRFWWWCVDYAPDGNLGRYNDMILAGSVGLGQDHAVSFVQAMVASCWIDRKPYFRVHDWWDYFGRFLQIKYKQNPAKWQEVQASYHNPPKNGSKNPPRNRSKTQDRPTLDRPTLTNQPEEKTRVRPPPGGTPLRATVELDAEWIESLKSNPAYQHLSLAIELGKMEAWLALPKNKHRKLTRSFVLNWLNKIEPPMTGHTTAQRPPAPPPKTDPIARGLWKQTYGRPEDHGYV